MNAFNEQDAKDSTATLHLAEEGDLIVRDLAYNLMHWGELLRKLPIFFVD